MDEFTQTTEEYIQKLPEQSQKIVRGNTWKKPLQDLGVKYSLTQKQKDILEEEVLFLLIGITDIEDLTATLIEEMDISDILAEQITEEVSSRVIDSITKQLTPPEEKNEGQTVPHEHPLDHAPDNLPIGESTPVSEHTLPEPNLTITPKEIEPPTEKKTDWLPDTPVIQPTEIKPQDGKKEVPIVRSIIRDKLNYVTKSPVQPENAPKPTQDPYREPIE